MAVALGVPETFRDFKLRLTNEEVQDFIEALGYKLGSPSGIEGIFYTDNREQDLLNLVIKILDERRNDENLCSVKLEK